MTVRIGPHEFDHVTYDARGDVLYLSIGDPQAAADSLVTPEGHVIRYDAENRVIGITLINAKWLADQEDAFALSLPVPVDDLALAFG